MTGAELRKAQSLIQHPLNDLNTIIRHFEQTLTSGVEIREGCEDPALQFLAALKQAQREGLSCIQLLKSEAENARANG